MTTIGGALKDATASLEGAGIENARSEARLLMAFAHGLTPTQIFSRENEDLDIDLGASFAGALEQRLAGKPLAHITGEREFWSLSFKVTPATLIPRPDSEAVIELAMKLYADRAAPERILDFGTGSGCLLIALLSEFKNACGVGVDKSEDAARIASDNAERLGVSDRAGIMHSSWADLSDASYDLIVSNPPYIPSSEIERLDVTVRDFEPSGALDGGDDGLDAYRSLFPCAEQLLSESGTLIVEIGIGQSADVTKIANDAGFRSGPLQNDIAGTPRALSFSKKGVGIAGAKG